MHWTCTLQVNPKTLDTTHAPQSKSLFNGVLGGIMKILSAIFAFYLLALPTLAFGATLQVDLDATQNTAQGSDGAAAIAAGDLIAVDFGVGQVSIDVIDGVYQAYRFASGPISCVAVNNCSNGWTVNYGVFDAAGTLIEVFGIGGTYATSAEALAAAQAAGTNTFDITTAGTYYISIFDGLNFRADNTGGVSLSVNFVAPTTVPLPASGLLLLGALGAGIIFRRKS